MGLRPLVPCRRWIRSVFGVLRGHLLEELVSQAPPGIRSGPSLVAARADDCQASALTALKPVLEQGLSGSFQISEVHMHAKRQQMRKLYSSGET